VLFSAVYACVWRFLIHNMYCKIFGNVKIWMYLHSNTVRGKIKSSMSDKKLNLNSFHQDPPPPPQIWIYTIQSKLCDILNLIFIRKWSFDLALLCICSMKFLFCGEEMLLQFVCLVWIQSILIPIVSIVQVFIMARRCWMDSECFNTESICS
jgi:hypothetical protein